MDLIKKSPSCNTKSEQSHPLLAQGSRRTDCNARHQNDVTKDISPKTMPHRGHALDTSPSRNRMIKNQDRNQQSDLNHSQQEVQTEKSLTLNTLPVR